MTMTIAELAASHSIINPAASLALGVPVTLTARGDMPRVFLGTVVEVTPERTGLWVRRYYDPADVSVWYSIREVEVATTEDLASAARTMLSAQYREVVALRNKVALR